MLDRRLLFPQIKYILPGVSLWDVPSTCWEFAPELQLNSFFASCASFFLLPKLFGLSATVTDVLQVIEAKKKMEELWVVLSGTLGTSVW